MKSSIIDQAFGYLSELGLNNLERNMVTRILTKSEPRNKKEVIQVSKACKEVILHRRDSKNSMHKFINDFIMAKSHNNNIINSTLRALRVNNNIIYKLNNIFKCSE